MTEKRYKIDLTNSPVLAYIDMITGKEYPITEDGIYGICDLLNELHEENRLLQMKYDAQRELYGQLNSDFNNLCEENRAVKDIIIDLDKSGEFWDRDTLIDVIKSIANELGVDLND